MTDPPTQSPPYRAALGVGLAVLLGFLATLAPTVTFWDAGELIASTRILGIPHPPGTPLLVLIGHVWGTLVPIGEWAFRTNLLTAVFAASSAAMFFLVVHESLGPWAGAVPLAEARHADTLPQDLPDDPGLWCGQLVDAALLELIKACYAWDLRLYYNRAADKDNEPEVAGV